MTWRTVRLREVAKIDRRGVDPAHIQTGTKYLGLENIESGGRILGVQTVRNGEIASSKFKFDSTHVLYGKLRPYLAKIALPDFEGICSTDILPIVPGEDLDRRYLAYFLKKPSTVDLATYRSTGANLPRLSPSALAEFKIPLPVISEQKRIADILDKSKEIEEKYLMSAAFAEELIRAKFLEMFGHPVHNPKKMKTIPLGEIIRVSSGQGLTASKMSADGCFAVYGGNGINGYHSEFMFEEPKIVIGRVGVYCGAVHLSQPRSWITDNALYVREYKMEINQKYLEWAVRLANLNQYAGRAAQPLISGSRIYPIEIGVPDQSAQSEFSAFALQQDKLLGSIRKATVASSSVCASISQRAFRGEL